MNLKAKEAVFVCGLGGFKEAISYQNRSEKPSEEQGIEKCGGPYYCTMFQGNLGLGLMTTLHLLISVNTKGASLQDTEKMDSVSDTTSKLKSYGSLVITKK